MTGTCWPPNGAYFECRLDVDSLLNVVDVLVEIHDVFVDGLEEKPKPFEDLQIIVLKLFIKLSQNLEGHHKKSDDVLRWLVRGNSAVQARKVYDQLNLHFNRVSNSNEAVWTIGHEERTYWVFVNALLEVVGLGDVGEVHKDLTIFLLRYAVL